MFPFEEMGKDKIITMFFELLDEPGVLSQVLKTFAAAQASVLTLIKIFR